MSGGITYYTYTSPVKGSYSGGVNTLYPGAKNVTIAHTHGNYDPHFDNNNFSKTDKSSAKSAGLPSFVVTTNGSLKRFDPITNKVTTISRGMPSDSGDPTRQNRIAPTEIIRPRNCYKFPSGY